MVANYLKLVLPHVISPLQSAFVLGRQITDNALVAYELVHYLRRKQIGKRGFMSIKLSISKTYDWVEWGYLERFMVLMGFCLALVSLITSCLSLTSYLVLINDTPMGHITLSMGLWQEDPLSPYLFLLCTKGLVSLLKDCMAKNQIQGIKICRGVPKVNHLLFIDERLIFYKAD